MTSKTSLNKRYAFTSAFGAGVVAINALVFLWIMFIPETSADTLVNFKLENPEALYMLIRPQNVSMFITLLVIQALVTAVMMFGFMLSKRGSGAYLSLPVSRGRLFASRYAAGLILITLPGVIYMTWHLFQNIRVLGYSPELLRAYVLVTFGVFVTLLTVYSITAACCLCVGTVPEALVFSLIVIFGGIFIAVGANQLLSVFLHGNAIGEYTHTYGNLADGLEEVIVPYMPVLNFIFVFERFGYFRYSADMFDMFWKEPMNGIVIIWFAASVLISFFAYKAFKRYKAENSGVLGVNRGLNFACVFAAVFFCFGLVCASVKGPVLFRIAVSLLFSFVFFILCRFLLTLNVKRAFGIKGLKEYGVMMAAVALVCLLGLSGLFGYSSYLPELSKIGGAAITYTGAPDFILGGGEDSNYSFVNSATEQEIHMRGYYDLIYTSEDEIRAVIDLHKAIIDAGADLNTVLKQTVTNPEKDRLTVQVHIRYGLKDGHTVIDRLYNNVPVHILTDMLKLDETDTVRRRVEEFLDKPTESYIHPVRITDCLFGNEYVMFDKKELSSEEEKLTYQELFDALKKDISNLPIEEKYFPKHAATAVISFPRLDRNEDDVEPVVIFSVSTGNNFVISGEPEDNPLIGGSTSIIRLYITESWTNTVAFLKEKGLYAGDDLPDTAGISEMYIERYRINPAYYTIAPYFRSYVTTNYTRRSGETEIGSDKYADILSLVRSGCYAAEGGYLVRIRTADVNGMPRWVHMFLPEADAPAYVKEAAGK